MNKYFNIATDSCMFREPITTITYCGNNRELIEDMLERLR